MTKVTRRSKAAAAQQQRGGGGGGTRGGGGGSGGGGKGIKANAAQVTAAQLYQQAQIALRFDDFDAAKDALRRAIKLEPQDSSLLDAHACLLAELADDGAKAALQQAVAAAPASGHEKYFYLAQLEEEPSTAIECSSRGLALLQSRLQDASSQAAGPGHQREMRMLSKALSSALCAHAEMLLGLACARREEALPALPQGSDTAAPDPRSHPLNAGLVAQVESALTQAQALQPQSPEPGQALAALRSEQGRSQEALAALRASMAFWWDDADASEQEQEEGHEASADMEADETPGPSSKQSKAQAMQELHEENVDEEAEEEPSLEFRFECAKLLLELDESTDTAVGVLSALVDEYDSNPDAWHLLALALYSGHQYDAALETAAKGQELLRRLGVMKNDEHWASFAELVDAIKDAAGQAAAAAGAAGIKPGF